MNWAACSPLAPNVNEIDQQRLVKHSKYFLWKKTNEKEEKKFNIEWLNNNSWPWSAAARLNNGYMYCNTYL